MKTSVEISVIMATYNRVDLLRQQIDCLLNQSLSLSRYEIIIVNDGSSDGTEEYLRTLEEQHTAFRVFLQQNQGPAAARNLGVSQSQGDILAFTDDDCLVSEDWLTVILGIFKREEVLAIQGRTTTDKAKVTPLTHQVMNEHGDTSIPTCNAAYRKAVFIDAGGFDTGFPFQNEDADLAWRVREMGTVVFAPDMLVRHPPRVDSFRKSARKMQNYVSEFMLFHKHPGRYQKYRFSSPWKTIYWRIMVQAHIYHFIRRIKYIRRPWLMIQGFALSFCWWGDLLRKLPVFWKANQFYRSYYADKATTQYAITTTKKSKLIEK